MVEKETVRGACSRDWACAPRTCAPRAGAPRTLVALLGALLCAGALAQSPAKAPATVSGYTFVRSLGGVEEYQLDGNGLTVLIAADHSAPVVTFQVTYRVGSRNEVTGTTGATHILE
jgi:zinc protease